MNGNVVLTEAELTSLWLCECGHDPSTEHNGLGCYGRISYQPLVTCECKRTDAQFEATVETNAASLVADRIAASDAALERVRELLRLPTIIDGHVSVNDLIIALDGDDNA